MKAKRRVLLLESGETQVFAELTLDLIIPKGLILKAFLDGNLRRQLVY